MRKHLYLIFILALLCAPQNAYGEMTSPNYTIYADSVGVGGGSYSESASYALSDTVGEVAVGTSTSATYEVRGGYQAMNRGTLTISVTTSSLSLGVLNGTEVKSASTAVTVNCDSETGYTLSASEVSGSLVTAVADGSVTAGQTEYGVTASGAHSVLTSDVAVTEGLTLASSAAPVVDSVTTITFKAAMGAGGVPGDYSQSITLTAAANF